MSVKERPYELAAYVLETEFEMRVLIDSMMAGVKSGRTYGGALLFGDLLRAKSGAGHSTSGRRQSRNHKDARMNSAE